MSFEFLTKPGRKPDILLYLLGKGESYQLRILEDLRMGPNTLVSAAESLRELGFLYERREAGWPTKRYYALTYKGEELARSLVPIEDILEETLEGFKSDLSKLLKKNRTRENLERIVELSLRLQEFTRETGEWEESLEHSKRIFKLSEKLKSEKSKAEAYRNIGFINQKREGYQEATENFERSMEIALNLEDFQGASKDEYALGVTHEKLGDYDKAMDHYGRCMEFARKVDGEIIEARARLGIGRIHYKRGRHRKSLDEMEKAVRKLEELDEFEELPRAYANLGSSSFSLDEEEALKWHERCIEASRKTGNIRMLGYGYSNAAACYINKHKWKKSEEYLERAMDIFQKLDEKEMICSVHLHFANFHRLRREWAKAREHFLRSFDVAKKSNLPYHLGDALFHSGLMHREKGEPDRAESDLERALGIFEEVRDENRIRRIRTELDSLTR